MAVRTIGTIVGTATEARGQVPHPTIPGLVVEAHSIISNNANLNGAGVDNKPIIFMGPIGGLDAGTVYYIKNDPTLSLNNQVGSFRISATPGGDFIQLTNDSTDTDYVIINTASDGSSQPSDPSLVTSAGRDALNDNNSFFQIDYGDYLERISQSLETLVASNTEIKNSLQTIKNLAEGDGVHIIGPWEWLGQVGIVQYLEDKGLDLAELKAKVEAIPKSFTTPGGGS